jgi:hypothetical protein
MPVFDFLAHQIRSAPLLQLAFVAILLALVNITIRYLAAASPSSSSAEDPEPTVLPIDPPASTEAADWTKRFNRSFVTGDFYVGFDLLLAAFIATLAELWRTNALTERAVHAGAYEEWSAHLDGVTFLAFSIAAAIGIGVRMMHALSGGIHPKRRAFAGYGLLALGVLMLVFASSETDAFQAPEVPHKYPVKGPASSGKPLGP